MNTQKVDPFEATMAYSDTDGPRYGQLVRSPSGQLRFDPSDYTVPGWVYALDYSDTVYEDLRTVAKANLKSVEKEIERLVDAVERWNSGTHQQVTVSTKEKVERTKARVNATKEAYLRALIGTPGDMRTVAAASSRCLNAERDHKNAVRELNSVVTIKPPDVARLGSLRKERDMIRSASDRLGVVWELRSHAYWPTTKPVQDPFNNWEV